MEQKWPEGRTVLIVERSINDAVALQDRIVGDVSRILTAYSAGRALHFARSAVLHDAIIDCTFDGVDEIVDVLKSRNVPFVLHAGQCLADRAEFDEKNSRVAQMVSTPARASGA